MPHGILLVISDPQSDEVEADYNTWYNEVHLPQILAVPGFVGARRFRVSEDQMPSQGGIEGVRAKFPNRYVALYEIDVDDMSDVVHALTEAAPTTTKSPAIAADRVVSVMLEEIPT